MKIRVISMKMEKCPRCEGQVILIDRSSKVEATCAYCHYVLRVYVLLKMPKLTKIMLLTGFLLLLLGMLLGIFTNASLAGDIVLGIGVASVFTAVINLLRTRT